MFSELHYVKPLNIAQPVATIPLATAKARYEPKSVFTEFLMGEVFHEKKLVFKYIRIVLVMENGSGLCSYVSESVLKKLYRRCVFIFIVQNLFHKMSTILTNSIAKVTT